MSTRPKTETDSSVNRNLLLKDLHVFKEIPCFPIVNGGVIYYMWHSLSYRNLSSGNGPFSYIRIYIMQPSPTFHEKWNCTKFTSCVIMNKLLHYSVTSSVYKEKNKIHISEVWWSLHVITVGSEPGAKSLILVVHLVFLGIPKDVSHIPSTTLIQLYSGQCVLPCQIVG